MSTNQSYMLELSVWEVLTLYRIISETFIGTAERRSIVRKVEDVYYDAAASAEVRAKLLK